MRTTFSSIHRDASAGIAEASARLVAFQRQVSTGKRIERASDDPSAAATVVVERGRQAALEQYTQSADSAKSRLTVADTTLSDLIRHVSAAEVAVLSAQGSTTTASQREAAARELESQRDAVLNDLNTSFRGTFLFAGAAGPVPPYAKNGAGVVSSYQGSSIEVEIDINRGEEVAIAFNGEALAKGADATDVFQAFDAAITAVRAGDRAGMTTALGDLGRAFSRATAVQSRIGASLAAIEDDALRLGEARRSTIERISGLEDANMAEAITGMTRADAAYRASLAAASRVTQLSLMDYLK